MKVEKKCSSLWSIDVKSSMSTCGYLYEDEWCVYISLYNTYTGTYMTHRNIFFICKKWIDNDSTC